MRKILFSIFLVVACSTTLMVSCQSDEAELTSQSKIELLKAKSKEFAKKYGVDVTLNDDSIAKYADQMTVESMEADYRAFAEMKNSLQKIDSIAMISAQAKKTLKKSFIKRRKVETETVTPDATNKSGKFEIDEKLVNSECCSYRIGYTASVAWEYMYGSPSCKIENLELNCRNPRCHQAMGPQCAICSLFFENMILHTTGKSENGQVQISADGFISGKFCSYSFNNVRVSVYLNEVTGVKNVSITM